MKTRFMQRVFSAQENGEAEVLDQIQNDIDIAREDGSCDADEYSIEKLDDDSVRITDKENGEVTEATVTDDDIAMAPVESDPIVTEEIEDAEEKEFSVSSADLKKVWQFLKKRGFEEMDAKTLRDYEGAEKFPFGNPLIHDLYPDGNVIIFDKNGLSIQSEDGNSFVNFEIKDVVLNENFSKTFSSKTQELISKLKVKI